MIRSLWPKYLTLRPIYVTFGQDTSLLCFISHLYYIYIVDLAFTWISQLLYNFLLYSLCTRVFSYFPDFPGTSNCPGTCPPGRACEYIPWASRHACVLRLGKWNGLLVCTYKKFMAGLQYIWMHIVVYIKYGYLERPTTTHAHTCSRLCTLYECEFLLEMLKMKQEDVFLEFVA